MPRHDFDVEGLKVVEFEREVTDQSRAGNVGISRHAPLSSITW